MATKPKAESETATPENPTVTESEVTAMPETDTAETPETETAETPEISEAEVSDSIKRFSESFAICLEIATTDLPKVLQQQKDGSNPEHQKQIANLERVIADGAMPQELLDQIKLQVESMKPQLFWKQDVVADMLAVFQVRASDEASQELVKAVNHDVLRRAIAGTGKGKTAGTPVVRVEGAVKEVSIACLECDNFKQPNRRSDAISAPYKIANDIRKHTHDAHGYKFNTKQIEEGLRAVVAHEQPHLTVRNEKGDPVVQVMPTGATAEIETPVVTDNGATAETPDTEIETV